MADYGTQQSPESPQGFFYGYVVVVAATFIMVVVYGAFYAFGVFFKPVLTEFGWTSAMTSGAFSASWVVHGLLAMVMGKLTDMFGPRLVMSICGLFLALGYGLLSQIGALWQLYLFYGLFIGIGMSGSFVPLMSIVARWFAARRSLMTGIVVTGIGIGSLLAPPVANWLIATRDWRVTYIILGILVFVVVVLAAQFLKRDPAQVGQKPYGENIPGQHQSKTDALSFNEALRTRQMWTVLAMFFCFAFCVNAAMVHIAPHAIELGISSATGANVLATIGGVSILGRIVLGNLADRIGNRQAFIIGFVIMSASLLWLIPTADVWLLYLFAIAFGFAYGGCAASESPLVATLFGLGSLGAILGVINLGFTTGSAIGPLVTGYLFDITGSYRMSFIVGAAIGLIGLALTFSLTPVRSSDKPWSRG